MNDPTHRNRVSRIVRLALGIALAGVAVPGCSWNTKDLEDRKTTTEQRLIDARARQAALAERQRQLSAAMTSGQTELDVAGQELRSLSTLTAAQREAFQKELTRNQELLSKTRDSKDGLAEQEKKVQAVRESVQRLQSELERYRANRT
jgi:hypothetical protein